MLSTVMSISSRRFFQQILFVILLVCIERLTILTTASALPAPIPAGVSLPLSGPAATYGEDARNVLQFANDQLGGKFKFIFEDDKCAGRDAVTVAKKLVSIDKVKYSFGPGCSGCVLSAAPVYEQAKVLSLVWGNAPKISFAGDYIFRVMPNDDLAAKLLVEQTARSLGSVAVLSEDTDSAQGFADSLNKYLVDSGVTAINESYQTGTVDFRAMLARLRSKKISAVFLSNQTEESFLIVLKQIRESGWSPTIYTSYWPASPSFAEKGINLAEGVVFVDNPDVTQLLDSQGKKLFEEFEAKYGKMRSINSVFYSGMAAVHALSQAIESGRDVKDYLYQTKFENFLGTTFYFDSNGDIQGIPYQLKVVKGGKVEVLPSGT